MIMREEPWYLFRLLHAPTVGQGANFVKKRNAALVLDSATPRYLASHLSLSPFAYTYTLGGGHSLNQGAAVEGLKNQPLAYWRLVGNKGRCYLGIV